MNIPICIRKMERMKEEGIEAEREKVRLSLVLPQDSRLCEQYSAICMFFCKKRKKVVMADCALLPICLNSCL